MGEVAQPYMQKRHAQVNRLPKKLNSQYLILTYLIPIALITVKHIIMSIASNPPSWGYSKNATKNTIASALNTSEQNRLFLAYHLTVDSFSISM